MSLVVDASVAIKWVINEPDLRTPEIAVELGHPAYDTFYLAMAEAYGTQLITADIRLLRRAASSPFAHLAISLEDAAAN